MIRYLRGIRHPDIYHGFGRKPPFFEGWYFKLVNADRQQRWAVIPGIFLAEDAAKNHAFIQVLDGMTGRATYHEYPAESFWAHPTRFELRVGDSTFSANSITLDINAVQRRVAGTVEFRGAVRLPSSAFQPGIMGPFAYIPAMECYHGIVSLDHDMRGSLDIDGHNVDFSGGRGYIEKDWGTNFPSAYVWMQSNHFSTVGTSLSASVARIPLWGLNFPGFIIALWHEGKHSRWATYTGARITHLHISETHVEWVVTGWRTRLTLTAQRHEGGLLMAPLRTDMHKRVDETMCSAIHMRLETRGGRLLLDDTTEVAALEVYGDLPRLVTS